MPTVWLQTRSIFAACDSPVSLCHSSVFLLCLSNERMKNQITDVTDWADGQWHDTGHSMGNFHFSHFSLQMNAGFCFFLCSSLGRQLWWAPAWKCTSLTTACLVTCIPSLTTSLLYRCPSTWLTICFSFFLNQAHNEEISRERNERQRLEKDLEEASRRLAMAHQDIRRLTNELDAAKNNNQDPSGMFHCLTVYNHKCFVCLH